MKEDPTKCVLVVDFTKFGMVDEGNVHCFVVSLLSSMTFLCTYSLKLLFRSSRSIWWFWRESIFHARRIFRRSGGYLIYFWIINASQSKGEDESDQSSQDDTDGSEESEVSDEESEEEIEAAWKPSIQYFDYYVQSTEEEVVRQVFPYVKVFYPTINWTKY